MVMEVKVANMMVTREMENKEKVPQKEIEEIESNERTDLIIPENIISRPGLEPVIEENVGSVQGKKGIEVPLPNCIEDDDCRRVRKEILEDVTLKNIRGMGDERETN